MWKYNETSDDNSQDKASVSCSCPDLVWKWHKKP